MKCSTKRKKKTQSQYEEDNSIYQGSLNYRFFDNDDNDDDDDNYDDTYRYFTN